MTTADTPGGLGVGCSRVALGQLRVRLKVEPDGFMGITWILKGKCTSF